MPAWGLGMPARAAGVAGMPASCWRRWRWSAGRRCSGRGRSGRWGCWLRPRCLAGSPIRRPHPAGGLGCRPGAGQRRWPRPMPGPGGWRRRGGPAGKRGRWPRRGRREGPPGIGQPAQPGWWGDRETGPAGGLSGEMGQAGTEGDLPARMAGKLRPSRIAALPSQPGGKAPVQPAYCFTPAQQGICRPALQYAGPTSSYSGLGFFISAREAIIRPRHNITRPALQYAGPACCKLAF
jgi:hypothetical protein